MLGTTSPNHNQGREIMKLERLTGLGLIILGAALAASAVLGPLVLGIIRFQVSESMENQIVGGDVASLLLAAPLAILAGMLWIAGHRLAPALALAPTLYAVYLAVSLVLGQQYGRYEGNSEQFFPLYLLVTLLGWTIAARAWSVLRREERPDPSPALRRLTGGVLLALGLLLGLAWARSIWGVMTGAQLPIEYLSDPNTYWTIKLLDTAFIIPAAVATGLGLMLARRTAILVAPGIVGFLTCMGAAVAGMAAVMNWRSDPAASLPFLALTALGTLALAILTLGWFRLCLAGTGPAVAPSPEPLRS